MCNQRVVQHFIVDKIEDSRHLTKSNKIRVKHFFYNFRQNRIHDFIVYHRIFLYTSSGGIIQKPFETPHIPETKMAAIRQTKTAREEEE